MNEKITFKTFINNVLFGTATGVVIGLTPKAIVSSILKLFGQNDISTLIINISTIFQFATPLLIGVLIAMAFKMETLPTMVVGIASFASSGIIQYQAATKSFIAAGTGDVINTMITASFTVLLLMLIGKKLGSLSIILMPIVAGVTMGTIGFLILPYVSTVNSLIGKQVQTFSTLQPLLMSILIAAVFSVLIISPISAVAIAMSIQLNGMPAGAAAMGVAATTIVLVVNSWKVNKPGITVAFALGGMKMIMPNIFRKPVLLLPCILTAMASAVPVMMFNISGTPLSAGFGLIGLVGPIASYEHGLNLGLLMICWFVVTAIFALVFQFICEKIFKLYDRADVFTLETA